jgi:hypothetical protein
MYDKKLKRSKDGLFIRYIGRNDKGTPEKFRLGYDPLVAEERVRLIAALWQEIEERTSARPFWDRKTLEAAKAIAKGMPATLPKRNFEDPIKYVRRLSEISKATGTQFEPMDPEGYQSGLRDLQIQMDKAKRSLSASLQVEQATGVTARQAIEAYESSIVRSSTLPNVTSSPGGAHGSTSLTRSGTTSPTRDSAAGTSWHSTSPT